MTPVVETTTGKVEGFEKDGLSMALVSLGRVISLFILSYPITTMLTLAYYIITRKTKLDRK